LCKIFIVYFLEIGIWFKEEQIQLV